MQQRTLCVFFKSALQRTCIYLINASQMKCCNLVMLFLLLALTVWGQDMQLCLLGNEVGRHDFFAFFVYRRHQKRQMERYRLAVESDYRRKRAEHVLHFFNDLNSKMPNNSGITDEEIADIDTPTTDEDHPAAPFTEENVWHGNEHNDENVQQEL